MAHYAYKHVAYDIDHGYWKKLGERFKKETGREPDGDSNYDGDNWYLAEMWIKELIEENKLLTKKLRKK